MIVSCAQVHIAHKFIIFPADDKRHLGVRLVSDQAINDMRTSLLQAIGERNIGCLIEARHEFDDDSYLFACASCADQMIDDR